MADLCAVLDVLRQRPAADLQAWGCAALRNLTEEGGADFRSRALEAGALQLVITALQQHEAVAQVQECGLAALSGFAKGMAGPKFGGQAVNGGLRLALRAIKEHYAEEEVCRWALSALSELLRVENTAEELGKYSFLDLVSFAMQRHPSAPQVQACGCAFLSRLALKSDEATVGALDKATRGIVFNAMEAHQAVEVQACGSSALGAFVLRGGHQKTMVESRAPHLLLEAMRRHPSNATVQEKAANALRLVVGSNGCGKALKLGAAQVLVSALQSHMDASSVLSACLTTLQCLVHVAPSEAAPTWGFALLAPETPRECQTQLLLQILQRYPENNSILDSALSLLWGSMGQDTAGTASSTACVAVAALDATPPRCCALGAAVLARALDAAVLPGKARKQLLRVIKLHPQNRMLQERAWEALLQVLRLTCDPVTEPTLDMASMLRNLVESLKRHEGPLQRIGCDIMTWCCLPNFCGAAASHREQLLELEAPLVVAEAMRKYLQVAEMQDSACACLQCLAADGPQHLMGVEDALLAALEAQQGPEVQIRSLDLLSALALPGLAHNAALEAVPVALRALRRYGLESSCLAEVAVRFLLRMVDSEGEDQQEPMEGIAGLVLEFLDEGPSPSLATRSLLRLLAQRSHDVATRILAARGLQPVAEAVAPPLLTLQLLHGLAQRGRAIRDALRKCDAAKNKALEALRFQEGEEAAAPEPETLRACACALWSRLCADGPAATRQLLGDVAEGRDGPAVPELLELLMQQLKVSDLAMRSWGFLTLQNFLCGISSTFTTLRHRLLHRNLLHDVALAAAEQSLASSLNTTQSMVQQQAARMKLETILMICLHTLGSSCDPNNEDLLSEEVLSMLIRGLSSSWALEVRERACFLLCFLANCNQKVKDTLLEGGSSLWKTMLEVLKDHLAAEEGEAPPSGEEGEEILLELSLPDGAGVASDGVAAELPVPLRALQLRRAELLLEAMQALAFEARVQVIACTDLRRLALLSMSAMAGSGADRDPQCRALVQRLPQGLGNTVQAMRQHERSDEVQRAAVLSLQALTRLCCSLEGEDVAIQRVVDMEVVPVLARALRNYPEDPQLQERGLDVLRLLSTRMDAVTKTLCELEVVPAVVEALNLNISKPKIQEYGLSLLAEVGWQGLEQQRVCMAQLGVEAVVRALKAFPSSAEVQTNGLAAVQALTSDNEECRVKFFSLCEILEMVLQAMGNFPLQEGVQAFGCAALISLAHSKSERIGALADLNCASMAESAMVGHPKSQRVVEFAEHLMQILKKG